MLYRLKLINVIKKTESETRRDELISLGYALIETDVGAANAPAPVINESKDKESQTDFDAMKITELRDYAAELGISLSGLKTKADIIEALKN